MWIWYSNILTICFRGTGITSPRVWFSRTVTVIRFDQLALHPVLVVIGRVSVSETLFFFWHSSLLYLVYSLPSTGH